MLNVQRQEHIKSDDYETPKSAFEDILHLIPRDKLIWDPFYCNGRSGQYMTELGLNVYHTDVDFFENNFGDIIISNPPFAKKKEVLTRLIELDKPFMLLLPTNTINYQYFHTIFNHKKIQIIIPPKRINFIKDGIQSKRCYFDCIWITYKMNFQNDIYFLK